MEQIRLTQTQEISLTSNVAGESSDGPTSALAAIDERVIADEVLGVLREHCKGVEPIVKGKRKVSDTFYSTITFGSEQSQVVEDQRQLTERVDS